MSNNEILTLFGVVNAVREHGGEVYLHHPIKPVGYLLRATLNRKKLRLVVPGPGSSDRPDVAPEADSAVHHVVSIAVLKNWLSKL